MASHIRWGIGLVGKSDSGGALVLSKVAACYWAIIEISAADLLLLRTSAVFPNLDSARLLVVGWTGTECLQTLADERERRVVPAATDSPGSPVV